MISRLRLFHPKKGEDYFKSNGHVNPAIKEVNGKKISLTEEVPETRPLSPKRDFVRPFSASDLEPNEMKEKYERRLENTEVEIVCNGIRYKGIHIEIESLPELICEECEVDLSLLKCEACNQVFCQKCFSLCHQRSEMGTILHPHEYTKMVRPIRHGDVSTIVKTTPYHLPDYECHERELLEARDITQPNTLTANSSTSIMNPVQKDMVCKRFMYNIGDTVIYKDPDSNVQMFGEIVSEWDLRNGPSAPTLIRGEGGGISWYIVENIGILTPTILAELECLEPAEVKLEEDEDDKEAKKKLGLAQNIPILQGVGHAELHLEHVLARQIDKRILHAEYVQENGPIHHLNPPKWNAQNDYKRISTVRATNALNQPTAKTRDEDGSRIARTAHLELKSRKDEERKLAEAGRKKQVIARVASLRTLDNASIASAASAGISNSTANMFLSDVEMRCRIRIMPENALVRPRDQYQLNLMMKNNRIRSILTAHFSRFTESMLHWAMLNWIMKIDELKQLERDKAAIKIQQLARKHLSQNVVFHKKLELASKLKEKWQAVHSRFSYCTKSTPGAVSWDQKVFFSSIRDVNRYAFYLRKSCVNFVRCLSKKRFDGLYYTFKKWIQVISIEKESELNVSHFRPYDINGTADLDEAKQRESYDKMTKLIHEMYKEDIGNLEILPIPKNGETSVHTEIDEEGYQRLGSMPMSRVRYTMGDGPQPYHPTIGFKVGDLPPLPVLPDLLDTNRIHDGEKKAISTEARQKYNSFRAKQEGPTDNSCWIIPGKLLMGRIPCGKARKKGPVDSNVHTHIDCVSQIMLAGVNNYVSLLSPDEEEAEIFNYNSQLAWYDAPISTIERAVILGYRQAKSTLVATISGLSNLVEQKNIEMEDFFIMDKHDIRYEESEKRRISVKAKKTILLNSISRTKKELDNFPSSSPSWIRMPFEQNAVPALDHIVPVLWRLEEKLQKGESIYVYSKDGTGRAALICGCILGRLYGLSATETLLRMQTYFDCQRSQLNNEVSVNCPRMRAHQEVLTRILKLTNRVYEGITYRTQSDPQTIVSSDQHYSSGTQIAMNKKNVNTFEDNAVIAEKKSLFLELDIPQKEEYSTQCHLQGGVGNVELYDVKWHSHTSGIIREIPTYRVPIVKSPTLKQPRNKYK